MKTEEMSVSDMVAVWAVIYSQLSNETIALAEKEMKEKTLPSSPEFSALVVEHAEAAKTMMGLHAFMIANILPEEWN